MDRFNLQIDGVSDPIRVCAFTAQERISSLYQARVFALVKQASVASVEGALSHRGLLTVPGADDDATLRLPGIVTAVELLHAFGDRALLEIVLRPKLWLLTLECHSRVWVKRKALDVVRELLDKAGVDGPQIEAQQSYLEHEHICQYRETDFTFLSRWLERDGLRYSFVPSDDGEQLCISDGSPPGDHHPKTGLRCVGTLDAGAAASVGQVLYRFAARRSARPARVEVADYFYPQPALEIRASHPVIDPARGSDVGFGGRAWSPAEAKRLAQVRAEQAAAEAVLFEGEGTVLGLRAGARFQLDEHPLAALQGEYLAVGLRHVGFDSVHGEGLLPWIDPTGQTIRRDGPPYRIWLEAVRSDVPYRPQLVTPWPRLRGLETARIDGEADGDYAQLDAEGRYRVKLLFDENPSPAERASARLRMLQPHGGAPEGCHFPLRKATEVLVAFIDGDPDQPVIVGAVPNPETPSPVTSANKTQNVIQTGGKNRIEIEDQQGSEYVALFSPPEKSTLHLGASNGPYADGHHTRLSTDGDARVHAGGSRHITIGGEQTEDVKGRVVEDYHSNQTTHVYAAWKETIDGSATQTISAGETRTVTGGVTETITGGETRSITGDQSEAVSAAVSRTTGASWQEMVGGSVTRTIGGSETTKVGGNLTATVGAAIQVQTPSTFLLKTGGSATLIAPAGCSIAAAGGFHNLDGEWVKCGPGEEFEIFVAKSGIFGLKVEVIGFCLSGVIMRNSATISKTAYKATEFEAASEEDETAAADNEEGAALICAEGHHTEA